MRAYLFYFAYAHDGTDVTMTIVHNFVGWFSVWREQGHLHEYLNFERPLCRADNVPIILSLDYIYLYITLHPYQTLTLMLSAETSYSEQLALSLFLMLL